MIQSKNEKDVLLRESLQLNYPQPASGNRIWIKKYPFINPHQKTVDFHLKSTPQCYQSNFMDRFGNKTILLTRSLPHTALTIELETKVALEEIQNEKPDEVRQSVSEWQNSEQPRELEEFCMESGHVIMDSVTRKIAQTLQRYSQDQWGNTVIAIRNWVSNQMRYKPGSTETSTLSSLALRLREGVCQDITHVFLSLIRSLKIPARYISGYQVGGTETHSWAEVYFPDGLWRTFDPTEQSDYLPKIAVARGRDYQDARPISGNFSSVNGQGGLITKIKVEWSGA